MRVKDLFLPENFSFAFLKIIDKNENLINFEWNNIQKDFIKNRTGRDLVLKSRQVGISTVIQAEIFRKLITKTTRAATLAHVDSSTQILRQISDRFYRYFPDYIKEFNKPKRDISNAVISAYPETNSSHLIGTAGNTDFGRGGSFSMFHGSEVAFWKDAEKIVAGIMQSGKPEVVLESTPNGAQGYFFELCMDSLAGRNNWKLHFYPWYKHSEYTLPGDEIELTKEEKELGLNSGQARWRRNKLIELKNLFYQEYPESVETCFLTSGKGYFSSLDLSETFTSQSNNERIPNHVYAAGMDFGQSIDYTFMTVIDRTENRQVDFIHLNKLPWSVQRLEIIKLYRKWNLSSLKAEANSIGEVNIEELEKEGLVIERFTTSNSSKSFIMQKLYEALENGLKLLDWNVQRLELNSIESKQTPTGLWSISAPNGLHDDTVIGLALAVTAKVSLERKARSWY